MAHVADENGQGPKPPVDCVHVVPNADGTRAPLESIQVFEGGKTEAGLRRIESIMPKASYADSAVSVSRFDLMEVHITIYGVSGVLRVTDDRRRGKLFSKTRRSNSNSFDGDCNSSGSSLYELPPTTAVVSCQRQVSVSSGAVVETFMPSLPLQQTAATSNSIRYSGSWPSSSGSLLNMSQPEPSTFKMLRVMKHEPYRPDRNIAQISSHVHETIDVNIYVGCGKDLIPLGLASLAITGDEEGETIMNLPAKQFPKKPKTPAGKRLKKAKNYFPHDPRNVYSLDENATLRVGVRVLPEQAVRHATEERRYPEAREKRKHSYALRSILSAIVDENHNEETPNEHMLIKKLADARQVDSHENGKGGGPAWENGNPKNLEDILDAIIDENVVIDLNDENSLIKRLLDENQRQRKAENGRGHQENRAPGDDVISKETIVASQTPTIVVPAAGHRKARSLEEILTDIIDKTVSHDIHEENSLIRKFVIDEQKKIDMAETEALRTIKVGQSRDSIVESMPGPPDTAKAVDANNFPGFLCYAMHLCSNDDLGPGPAKASSADGSNASKKALAP